MNKISAVIITKNEERNIARCLDSLDVVVDEILVIDSFSEDRTVEIAREYGAKVIESKWLGYGETKNLGNRLAQNDYILSIDADEALSPQLAASILALKEEMKAPAYEMNRILNYCGKWIRYGGFYPDKKIRLFHRGMMQWDDAEVHEKLYFLNEDLKDEIQWIEGDLLHYSYHSISDHISRLNRYSNLASLQLAGRKALFAHMIFNSAWRFIHRYFIRGGFRDGYMGFILCRNQAFEVYLKYAKALHVRKTSKM